MTQPGGDNPKEIPGQGFLNDVGNGLDKVLPGDHAPLGDTLAGDLDNNPQDNNEPSSQQSGGVLDDIANAVLDGLSPLKEVQKLMDLLSGAWLPTAIIRVCCFIGGSFFIIFAIVLLAREVKSNASDS